MALDDRFFSQFTGFLWTIRDRLDAEGIPNCYLDGRTRDRGRRIDEFKNSDAPVFLISLKAGGFGKAPDTLKILDDLYQLTGSERIDLLSSTVLAPWPASEPSPRESRCPSARRAASPMPSLQPSWSDSIPTGSGPWIWS